MPNQTFFNLPEEKRQRIIDAAVDEFSRSTYGSASVARIVEDAGIPRGSFYQYFVDLKDLYKYMLDLASQKKISYMYELMGKLGDLEAFQIIRGLYDAALRFAKDDPKLAAIGNNFLKEDEKLKQEIYGELGGRGGKFFEDILRKGQEKGEIDPEADVEVAALMFFSMNVFIVDHLLSKTKDLSIIDDPGEFLSISEKMLYIMENGIKNKERK